MEAKVANNTKNNIISTTWNGLKKVKIQIVLKIIIKRPTNMFFNWEIKYLKVWSDFFFLYIFNRLDLKRKPETSLD